MVKAVSEYPSPISLMNRGGNRHKSREKHINRENWFWRGQADGKQKKGEGYREKNPLKVKCYV
jgi:hypothetical protein